MSLQERLDRLAAEGARAFDPPAFRCVEVLLERARALGGGARERLEARAAARLDALSAALLRGRADADAALGELAAAGVDPPPEVKGALARGDLAEAAREARRRLRPRLAPLFGRSSPPGAGPRPGAPGPRPWLARLREEAALSFRESLGAARATIAVARAVDRIPESAGPYNPQALAARTLQIAESLDLGYVRALLEELDDLAALEAALGSDRSGKVRTRRKAPQTRRRSRT